LLKPWYTNKKKLLSVQRKKKAKEIILKIDYKSSGKCLK